VPQWGNLRRALASSAWAVPEGATEDELARHPAVCDVLRERVSARLADVAGYEQVKKFHVLPRPFTVAAEELTVSLKTRRGVIFERYKAELEALYRE
jgi:long-chain acyl-CoA synthetase